MKEARKDGGFLVSFFILSIFFFHEWIAILVCHYFEVPNAPLFERVEITHARFNLWYGYFRSWVFFMTKSNFILQISPLKVMRWLALHSQIPAIHALKKFWLRCWKALVFITFLHVCMVTEWMIWGCLWLAVLDRY